MLLEKARLTRTTGATGAVTLIQRFGSALNLNVHFHMLFLDRAYLVGTSPPAFRRIGAPHAEELGMLIAQIAERTVEHSRARDGSCAGRCPQSRLTVRC